MSTFIKFGLGEKKNQISKQIDEQHNDANSSSAAAVLGDEDDRLLVLSSQWRKWWRHYEAVLFLGSVRIIVFFINETFFALLLCSKTPWTRESVEALLELLFIKIIGVVWISWREQMEPGGSDKVVEQ